MSTMLPDNSAVTVPIPPSSRNGKWSSCSWCPRAMRGRGCTRVLSSVLHGSAGFSCICCSGWVLVWQRVGWFFRHK